jgi:hypothetical protein
MSERRIVKSSSCLAVCSSVVLLLPAMLFVGCGGIANSSEDVSCGNMLSEHLRFDFRNGSDVALISSVQELDPIVRSAIASLVRGRCNNPNPYLDVRVNQTHTHTYH